MSQNNIWEKLKDFSTIAAGVGVTLYVLGYIIHVVHYFYILGIDIALQPLEYIKTGGDFCASVLVSIPQLFSHYRDYLPALFRTSSWIVISVSIVLFYLSLLFFLISKKKFPSSSQSKWLYWLMGIFLLSGMIMLIWQEHKLLAVKKVLQTFNLAKVKEAQENIKRNSKEPLNVRIDRIEGIYLDYIDNGGDKTEGFKLWEDWYNIKASKSSRQSRLSLYLAFLFLSIMLMNALWLYKWALKGELSSNRHRFLNYGIIISSFVIIFFFSCFAYAIVGKSYEYPVVTLGLSSKDEGKLAEAEKKKPEDRTDETKVGLQTHHIYLMTQTDRELIVYDRLDFFKVKYIPRSRVIVINQLFVASPFENCSTKDSFIPCETALEREDLWIEEF